MLYGSFNLKMWCFLRRLANIWPAALLLASVIIIDQSILVFSAYSDPNKELRSRFMQFENSRDTGRPQLIVIGSSRSKEGLPVDIIRRKAREAGLPHQVTNLSIGGGGTPTMLYAALRDWTTVLDDLSPDSVVVYVLSYFEMNFLKLDQTIALNSGFALLSHHSMINPNHWAYGLFDYSGFARMIAWSEWKRNSPKGLARIIQESVAPFDPQRTLKQSCNFAGRHNYKILPINKWALDHLAVAFGDRLILLLPPVSSEQRLEDRRFGLEKVGGRFLEEFSRSRNIPLVRDAIDMIPDSAFMVGDCDHLKRRSDQIVFAQFVIETILNRATHP